MTHLVTVIEELLGRQVGFRALCDGAIDTTTASGRARLPYLFGAGAVRAAVDSGAHACRPSCSTSPWQTRWTQAAPRGRATGTHGLHDVRGSAAVESRISVRPYGSHRRRSIGMSPWADALQRDRDSLGRCERHDSMVITQSHASAQNFSVSPKKPIGCRLRCRRDIQNLFETELY